MARFLLEIGSEELPSRFLKNEEKDLASLFEKSLQEAKLEHGRINVMTTPRRAAVIIDDIAPMQSDTEEVIMGPPARVAFTSDGLPSKALEGFAKGHNVDMGDIFTLKTEKGEYMAVRKKSGGRPAMDILSEICPAVISSLPFAKRMRWGGNEFAYARPLRWILAILDSEVVPFSLGHMPSGNLTYGHRVHGAGPFTVADVAAYDKIIAENCAITLDPARRRSLIMEEGNAQARAIGGEIIWKDSLLEEVEGLAEHPVALLGDFDRSYLEIPSEVLLTSMESHQKSFGVKGADGKLLPHFLTVLNITPEDIQVVKKGWEKVLRARLEDARFFWRADLRTPLSEWLARLDSVIFIGPLGSMGEKGGRLEKLCRWMAEQIDSEDAYFHGLAAKAGRLAKADLVSGMVGEFDTLQGVMGGIYAAAHGEPQDVANAIAQQYLPAGPDSPLPQSMLGSLLSIADKADTLAGCFGLNMIPTGVADPNGLRRCALGIIRILTSGNLDLRLGEIMARARELYGEKRWKLSADEAGEKLLEFFRGRLKAYFQLQGYDTVMIDAVMAAGIDHVADCQKRLEALASFAKNVDYAKVMQTLKRVENISRKAGIDSDGFEINHDLLVEEAEKKLSARLDRLLPQLDAALYSRDYQNALAEMANLREPVDNFFENVMVLCDDPALRHNRLALLDSISRRFMRIARLAAMQI